eukprot:2748875-Pleurochrysis_carterae.AAC.1
MPEEPERVSVEGPTRVSGGASLVQEGIHCILLTTSLQLPDAQPGLPLRGLPNPFMRAPCVACSVQEMMPRKR